MIHLRLFGTVGLVDEKGNDRDELLAQQKRAGLLAYLAVARPRGSHSRESLLGLFWPELTDKRARSALNQALYYLRNALGDDAIYSRASENVCLVGEEIECDVTKFEAYLVSGNLSEAVALYRGPFMDGFSLSGLPVLERWIESERARLGESATRAVWHLADRAAARGDADEAIEYARRGIELSHDEGSVRKLIEIRDRFGDRVGAIREYDRFARHVARELEAEPSPETQALVRQIRARTASSATPPLERMALEVSPPTRRAHSIESRVQDPVSVASPASRPAIADRLTTFGRRPAFRVAALLAIAAVISLAFAPLASGDKPSLPERTSVAVIPFSFTGDPLRATATHAVAGLLDADINAAGAMRTIDWRTLEMGRGESGAAIAPDAAARLARKFEADLFVLGTVNEAVGRYRITGSLYSVFDSQTPQVTAIVECDASSLFAAIDTLSVRLFSPRRRAGNGIRSHAGKPL